MNYKEVLLKTRTAFTPSNQKMMEAFFDRFDNHIYFERRGEHEVCLFINNLDWHAFKSEAIKLKAQRAEPREILIVDDFVEALSKIGSYSINNRKRVYVDFNKERKVKNRKEKALRRNPNTKVVNDTDIIENRLPLAYENKIICGDSLQVLEKLPPNCVDLMITSPPYNFGLAYEANEDDKKWGDYFNQLFEILRATKRVLKYGGRMIINVQPLFSDYIPTHHILSKYLLDLGMLWKGEIMWEKNNYNCKYTAWGSWKSPSSPYLKYTWEFIEVFCKGDLKHPGKAENIDISAEEFKKMGGCQMVYRTREKNERIWTPGNVSRGIGCEMPKII